MADDLYYQIPVYVTYFSASTVKFETADAQGVVKTFQVTWSSTNQVNSAYSSPNPMKVGKATLALHEDYCLEKNISMYSRPKVPMAGAGATSMAGYQATLVTASRLTVWVRKPLTLGLSPIELLSPASATDLQTFTLEQSGRLGLWLSKSEVDSMKFPTVKRKVPEYIGIRAVVTDVDGFKLTFRAPSARGKHKVFRLDRRRAEDSWDTRMSPSQPVVGSELLLFLSERYCERFEVATAGRVRVSLAGLRPVLYKLANVAAVKLSVKVGAKVVELLTPDNAESGQSIVVRQSGLLSLSLSPTAAYALTH